MSDHALLLPVEALEILVKLSRQPRSLHDEIPVLGGMPLSGTLLIILLHHLDLPIALVEL